MTQEELLRTLEELRKLPHETEWVEFKQAKHGFGTRDICQYFSALSNEANLKQQPSGWLVFGIENADRSICGTHYREDPAKLDGLKHEVAVQTGGVTFTAIHVVNHTEGRVVMCQIPPAPRGMPVTCNGFMYGRAGESLGALTIPEMESIRSQAAIRDWSAEICDDAELSDLSPAAIAQARRNFHERNANKDFAAEIDEWSDQAFLDRAKITKEGRITRAALLLLGKPEATHHLEPAVAQLTWKLEGAEQAYEHFGPPFLLATNELYSRIRNTVQKVDVPGQLVPLEVPKYEKWVILEALHNAIAHQDYSLQGRAVVTETVDRLIFESSGSFFEGSLADYTITGRTPQHYRNRFLADAMVNVNMIDTMGYGIRRMYEEQRKRFYPLPDFELSDLRRVVVTVHGKVIDPNYTAVLMVETDLPFGVVMLLDQVQKRKPISHTEAAQLRRRKLIEGRYPNQYVAANVASATDERAQYIKNRAFDDGHYKDLILEYLRKYHEASRKDIETLLFEKLSDVLSDSQKRHKVKNLLYAMAKRDQTIRSVGSGSRYRWELVLDEKSGP